MAIYNKSQNLTNYAGFWLRLVADILDSLILTGLSWIIQIGCLRFIHVFLALYLKGKGQSIPAYEDTFNPFFVQIFNLGIYFCLAFPYFVWGHFRWGTTLGKKPLNIYVVNESDLGSLKLNQSIIRFFSYGLSYLPFCAGFLMTAFQPKKQGLHDLIAKTLSIHKVERTNNTICEEVEPPPV
ncbi:MAG: RDD family protein [Bdellovibrio sp.]|nr:RDD family protein [Bdellovibrio sp.]